ncbi:hypothetical protein N798_00145 [Knoellia flava TL1]|uniref:Uncharacterized protein n=2 Tax=Knoellia flava TaxID=913969 RepID=A0A8H9FUD4_9MICO|nr:hypothetical protein [Knoellia flava]KGN35999.1 hypothetical protein N798_00145 [Knoellia flava TL1]GGB81540.1 hypothetical protein GCM10011314_21440 [Knoellia flava]
MSPRSTRGSDAVAQLKSDLGSDIKERGPQAQDELTAEGTYEPTADEAKTMLEAVRKRADGWRNGIGATFTLILASLAIKPGEGFMKYTGDTRTALMAVLGLSIASALAGLLLLVRAANGPSWLTELVGPDATPERYLHRVAGARQDMRRGQLAWGLSLVLFCIAVGVTWFSASPT